MGVTIVTTKGGKLRTIVARTSRSTPRRIPGGSSRKTKTTRKSTGTGRGAKEILGLEKVIAFYNADLESQTFARSDDWKYWSNRGGVAASTTSSWEKNVDEASDFLAGMDFGANPNPVINIDELGWDYDGGIDRHSGRSGRTDCATSGGWRSTEKPVLCGPLTSAKTCGKKSTSSSAAATMAGTFARQLTPSVAEDPGRTGI